MRHRTLLLPVFLVLAACRATPDGPEPPAEEDLHRMLLASAIASMENGGSEEAEAYLAAAGERAVPALKELLAATEDPRVRQRVKSLLLYAGEGAELSVEDRVGVLLQDISRDEPHPYVGIKALDRILELGDEAIPPLESAAERSDARGQAARRLLSLLREEQ